jgi:hypothetical protein
MSVTLTILADSPSMVERVFDLLSDHLTGATIDGDDVLFEFVLGDEAIEEALAGEHDAVQAEARPVTWDVTETSTRVLSEEEIDEPAEQQAAAIRERNGSNPSATDRIVELLTQHPDRTFTSAQVSEHLPDINSGSVPALLNQEVGRERITKAARGQYQAIDRSAVHDARRRAAAEAM